MTLHLMETLFFLDVHLLLNAKVMDLIKGKGKDEGKATLMMKIMMDSLISGYI